MFNPILSKISEFSLRNPFKQSKDSLSGMQANNYLTPEDTRMSGSGFTFYSFSFASNYFLNVSSDKLFAVVKIMDKY